MTKNKDIEELLVFMANDSLKGEEKENLEAAISNDGKLADELKLLSSIREQMRSDEVFSSPGEMGLARLKRELNKDESAANDNHAPKIWRMVAMIAIAVLAGQSVYQLTQNQGPDVILAGDETNVSFGLRVLFAPDATEAEIRNLLINSELQIVAGPSAIGFYTLTALNADARDAAVTALEAQIQFVESVEVLE